jgi:hypothetical protein
MHAGITIIEKPKTPCGYPAGPLKASDGTRYEVRETGQIVRRRPKMGKAERKRHKKERAEGKK